jgi:hypothetical protein
MNFARIFTATAAAFLCGWASIAVKAQDASPPSNKAHTAARQSGPLHQDTPSAPAGPFLVKPYLQLGYDPAPGKVVVVWHAPDVDAVWTAAIRTGADRPWQVVNGEPSGRRVAVPTIEPHRIYQLALTGLQPGQTFSYQIIKDQNVVFEAEARAPRSADQIQRFVVFGDCGANTAEEKAIAYRTYLSKPDYVMIPGDIVYDRGRISEYRTSFWPMYNADTASPSEGAPLLRSTIFVAAPGNHDIASRDLGKIPDGLAYFYYWAQPLNGPIAPEGTALVAPVPGPKETKQAFLKAAGPAFPQMANFSFDYGNAHWTVLDANATVDWTDSQLQEWVSKDLEAAKGAQWRFVSFHQPGFNSSKKHFEEQYMRILAPVFEAGKVDVVFNGHVHNYQRSYPMTFVPAAENGAKPISGPNGKITNSRLVPGKWTLDRTFDGKSDTTPEGVIYIVTGAGGQHLYNPEQQDDPASWQEFTVKHISKEHTLTIAQIEGPVLTIRQVNAEGIEVDRLTISK